MEKPWGYHGEWSASGSAMANSLGACGPLGFGLGTSLGTLFTMIPPRLFQIMSHYMIEYIKKYESGVNFHFMCGGGNNIFFSTSQIQQGNFFYFFGLLV